MKIVYGKQFATHDDIARAYGQTAAGYHDAESWAESHVAGNTDDDPNEMTDADIAAWWRSLKHHHSLIVADAPVTAPVGAVIG